uniref:Prolamin-like domain-containing protein n=1 Tax=Cajanus cajan TaxID=3821 RepID=A0A151QXJ1_CAJCA|nr:hypothetical protein KK1_044015 [Cajanus cajan]
MTSLNGLYVIMAFVLSLNLLIYTSISFEAPQPSQGPSYNIIYAPRPSSTYENYLKNCASKLKPQCGEQIFFNVFFGNQTISNYCCVSLVNDLGKTCHSDITKFALNLPTFKPNQNQILYRCEKAWNDCSSISSPSLV